MPLTRAKKKEFESREMASKNQKRIVEEKSSVSTSKRKKMNESVDGPCAKRNNPEEKQIELPNLELLKSEDCYHLLPHVPLRVVCSYLDAPDLINLRFVCQRWREVTFDKSVWKTKYLTLREGVSRTTYEMQLKLVPLIGGIYFGFFENEEALNRLVKSVVRHIRDLRFLRGIELVATQVKQLSQKFTNLERVNITIDISEIIEVLQALQFCKKLNQLYLYWHGNIVAVDIAACAVDIAAWRETVKDLLGNSFSSLRTFDLVPFQMYLKAEDVLYILERKKNQLTCLCLLYNSEMTPDILDVLSKCPQLTLHLKLFDFPATYLSNLKYLKSVNIYCHNKGQVKYIESIVTCHMSNVHSFSLNSLASVEKPKDIVNNVVTAFPNLRVLKVPAIDDNNMDEQFSRIGNLSSLWQIRIDSLHSLTYRGFSYLSDCPALTTLHINFLHLNRDSLKELARCSKLYFVTFGHCTFLAYDILTFVSSVQELRKLDFINCRSQFDFTHATYHSLEKVCKAKNIKLSIN